MNFSDEELDELLGAFALDAVDADERDAVEHYLSRSATAREEVRNHYEVAMALATTPGQAPTALWDRIEANMLPHVAPSPAVPATSADDNVRSISWAPTSGRRSDRTDRVGPSGRPRGGAGAAARFPGIRWAAPAAAAAVFLAAFATVSIRQHQTITGLRSDVAAARATAKTNEARADRVERLLTTAPTKDRVIQQLLATRGTTIAQLDTPSGVPVVEVVLAPDGQGYLVSKALPALASGRTYQLWGVADGVVLSLGIFGSAPKTLEFAAHEKWTKFVLTEEQSPGVPTSSQPAFAAGEVEQI